MKNTHIEIIDNLLEKNYVKNSPQTIVLLNELKSDIIKDFYFIVVVGEFNRGKSTFINALLGKTLLPTDILPETATINAIIFNDEPRLSIVTDSSEREGKASIEFLKNFSAQIANGETLRQIKYIKIGYPLELLRERIVLVDTPGVFDLSEQNANVTYNFIPKADTIIFVLDATSPLKKSERDFILEHLIPFGITDILFLLNKYDNIDEDEDQELLDNIKRRLEKAFVVDGQNTLKNVECLPVSSLNAIEGIETQNDALIESSGINEVKTKLMEMLTSSRIEKLKNAAYRKRLLGILHILSSQLKSLYAIKNTDSESLQNIINKLNNMLSDKSQHKADIEKYAENVKHMIYFMTDKSVDYFRRELKEKICDSIESYNQDNFKTFIENTVAKSVKKHFKAWINNYSPIIDELLAKLEQEIARGISRNFNQNVRLASDKTISLGTEDFSVAFSSDDISNVNIKAGAIAAAGSIGLTAILGGGILPLVGFAALPFLRKKILDEHLKRVKAEVVPQVEERISELIFKLNKTLHAYIDARCKNIVANAESAYENLISDLRFKVQSEIESNRKNASSIHQELKEIQKALTEIKNFQDTIKEE